MKTDSIKKGFAILSISSFIVKLMSLLYVPLLNIIIGSNGYGIYNAAYSLYSVIYIVLSLGISTAISKIVSQYSTNNANISVVELFNTAISFMFVLSFSFSIIMFIFSNKLANILNFPEASLSIKLLSPAITITSLLSIYRGYFQGKGIMMPTAISQIVEQIFNVAISLFFSYSLKNFGIHKACAGATVGTTIGATISLIYLHMIYIKSEHNIGTRLYISKKLLKEILKYTLPIVLTLGIYNLGNLVDISNIKSNLLLLGFTIDEANSLSGNLANFYTLINIPITLISSLSIALLPALSSLFANNDVVNITHKINYALKICILISIPSCVGLSVLSKPIYALIFPKSSEGFLLMKFGSPIVIIWSLFQIQSTILQSLNKTKVLAYNILIGIILRLFFNSIFIKVDGLNIIGALIGIFCGFLISVILNFYSLKKILKLNSNLYLYTCITTASSMIMGFVVCILYNYLENSNQIFNINISLFKIISLFSVVLLGIIIYIIMLFILMSLANKTTNVKYSK